MITDLAFYVWRHVWAQVFNYDRGQHDVWQVTGPSCNFNGSRELAGLTKSRFRIRLTRPGVYYFACSVDGHCDSGMHLTVKVSSAPPWVGPSFPGEK